MPALSIGCPFDNYGKTGKTICSVTASSDIMTWDTHELKLRIQTFQMSSLDISLTLHTFKM